LLLKDEARFPPSQLNFGVLGAEFFDEIRDVQSKNTVAIVNETTTLNQTMILITLISRRIFLCLTEV